MITQRHDSLDWPAPTTEEWEALFTARLEALHAATRAFNHGQPLPIAWRIGWTATLRLYERDLDGSLRASVVCSGPKGRGKYTRHIRLVPRTSTKRKV